MTWHRPTLMGRALTAFALLGACIAGGASSAQAGATVCPETEGDLAVTSLSTTLNVLSCDLVGRVVTYDGTGVAIPEAATAVSVDAVDASGETHGFTVEVATDGKLSYTLEGAAADASTAGADRTDSLANPTVTAPDQSTESNSTDADAPDASGTEVADADAATALGACSDGAYTTADRKEYGSYEWYVGDGGMPGALSQDNAKWAFWDAIDNITGSYNNCGYGDEVGAAHNYRGPTSYEADINSSSQCTDRDGLSTWDAGNLAGNHVAVTCSWTWPMLGVKNDLREADVRYNTTDFDFTNSPTSSCYNKYDIRSVGTHEAGHVFGMGHVGSGHDNLTMYTNSFLCTTKARTLGKGDVLGLRSIY
ncbi:peptidase M10 [Streptomyces sp. NPDC051940]|uniref:peptidase M10 n=1 Tax=Streptomyces sp. NPDC051940 TaxID=3155675 RepID=UPI00344AE32C